MNKLNIQSVEEERIKIDVLDADDGIIIKFIGDIDMEDPSIILDPMFAKLHDGSVQAGIKIVSADFTELNFLNSSGIKTIAVHLLKSLKKYKILINSELTWQKVGIIPLRLIRPKGEIVIE